VSRTRWALVYFVGSTALLVAPLYTVLGNHIEPRVLGQPWSLVWVLGVITANTLVLALLHAKRWIDHDE
jgi:hypothetical protein